MAICKGKLITILSLLATNAAAEEQPVAEYIAQLPEGMEAPSEPTPDEDNYAHEDDEWLESSLTEKQERSRNLYTILAEPIGIAIAPLPTSGFTFGYTLSPDLLVETSYAWGGDEVNEVDYKVELATIRAKIFFSDSGYINTGLGHRNVRGQFTDQDTIDIGVNGSKKQLETATSTFVAEFALGNKWQMDHFVIGCDWLGVNYPFKQRSHIGFDSQAYTHKAARTYNRIATRPVAQLLRLYFGSNF